MFELATSSAALPLAPLHAPAKDRRAPRKGVIGDASIADMSFDHFVGERGNERFDACLPLQFVASLSLGAVTSANVANVIQGDFLSSGTLVFHGRPYPISIGGVSYGFTFGASATDFVGEVSNIRTPFDVNGVYGAAGAGIAVGPGAGGIVLVNQNGAVLTLSGRQMGLIVAADLNGLVIWLR